MLNVAEGRQVGNLQWTLFFVATAVHLPWWMYLPVILLLCDQAVEQEDYCFGTLGMDQSNGGLLVL